MPERLPRVRLLDERPVAMEAAEVRLEHGQGGVIDPGNESDDP